MLMMLVVQVGRALFQCPVWKPCSGLGPQPHYMFIKGETIYIYIYICIYIYIYIRGGCLATVCTWPWQVASVAVIKEMMDMTVQQAIGLGGGPPGGGDDPYSGKWVHRARILLIS